MSLLLYTFAVLVTGLSCYALGFALGVSKTQEALGPSLEERFQAALAEGLLTEEDLKEIGISPQVPVTRSHP